MSNRSEGIGSPLVFAVIVFLLISGLVVSTWFRGGFIYGGAEVGFFTYNPERWLEISKYVWWDAVAPGQLIPHFITSAPFYFYFYLLQLTGLSAQNIQQIFFLILLFLMGFGVYLLSADFFDSDRKKYSLVAGLFYIFNVYTLVQVWHRFLYSTMVLAAVLPFLLLFWRRWVKDGAISNLSLFLLVNFLSVYMYGNLASLATVWIALSLISLAEVFFPWQGKAFAGKLSVRFVGGFTFFLLTNIWWIAPTFSIAPGLLPQQHSSEDNLGTLVSISKQTIMPYLLQLANPYYLFYRQELGQIYSNIIFKIIPWMMATIIFLGLIVSLKLKNYAKYSVIFIVCVLLAKGAASPFSYPYIFAFEHSYILGVLRNPFEKLGILLAVFGAILFAIGLKILFKWGSSRFGSTTSRLISIMVLLALFGYAWPMLGGRIFGTEQYPVEVEVPESYKEANNWLKQQEDDQGVILHLPFSGGDVVTYTWNKGYHGVDQNEILFTSLPSLSRVVGIKRIDDTLRSLTYIFTPPFSNDPKQILRVLQFFNVKFIVLHKDINWKDKDTYGDKGAILEPNSIEKVLDNLDFLQKQNQFGQLIIYKLTDENYKTILTVADNIQIIYPGGSTIMQILSKTKDGKDMITPVFEKVDEAFFQSSKQTLVFPDRKIEYFESSPSAIVAKTNDSFNKLLQLKAYFKSIGYLQRERLTDELIEATKKLVELPGKNSQIADYERLISSILGKYSKSSTMRLMFGSDFPQLLRFHILVLNQIGAFSVSKMIENEMIKMEVFPKYKSFGTTLKFTIPIPGEYEILTDSKEKSEVMVGGREIISEGEIAFDQGDYEISIKELFKDDVVLRLKGLDEDMSISRELDYKKESPVSYSGKIRLVKPSFIIFTQGFHPGWRLTLAKDGIKEEVREHFLGNLYNNAWWVDKIGEYDFKIEFTPQKIVEKGVLITLATTILLVVVNLYIFARRVVKQ